MSAPPETLIASATPPDSGGFHSDLPSETTAIAQFQLALSLYIGWSALAWFSAVAGTISITPQSVTILLIGIGASNLLFFVITRSSALLRPPAETIALAQSVVAIAWATLFTSMSTGADALIIGIYTSIVVFALLRVSRGALHQVVIFAVISYSVICLVKALSTEPAGLTAGVLMQMLTFAGIMLCLSLTGRSVYRRHHRLISELGELRSNLQRKHSDRGMNSVNRRYILELLAREKGRTDRSNVPFCICVFTLDHIAPPSDDSHEYVKARAMKLAEVTIRQELRDMDSLNPTGFHECFGPYSDKEYIAILPQTNLHGAQRSAERVLTAVTTPLESASAHIKLCGGIAEYRRGESLSALLARAQDALGKASSSGVSCVSAGHSHSHSDSNSDRGRDNEHRETRHAAVVRLETRRR